MLIRLHIQNLAIIDELTLDFEEGFTSLTGETGAGKSIILDALNLVLGERAFSDQVRTGADKAMAEALFDISNHPPLLHLLDFLNITSSEELVVRREILAQGRGRCLVNNQLVPLNSLKKIGDLLADLHGQHQHQSLLKVELHREMADAYGGASMDKALGSYKKLYQEYLFVQSKLKAIQINEQEMERQKGLLEFQISEIKNAHLQENEDLSLEEEISRLRHAVTLQNHMSKAINILFEGGMETESVNDLLGGCEVMLSESAELDPSLAEVSNQLSSARAEIEDIASTLRSYALNLDQNPARLEEAEDRLFLINKLKSKYGNAIGLILKEKAKLEEQLFSLVHNKEERKRLAAQRDLIAAKLVKEALGLSEKRRKLGAKFSKQLCSILGDLQMPKVRFQVRLGREEDPDGLLFPDKKRYRLHEFGVDLVEFLISTNSGEELKPLRRIASGGELSRIMLALKEMMRSAHKIPTLVFDEIDTGISGKTGASIGEKMADLSREYQIICITHLPQIAVKAHTHFLVKKKVASKRALTRVEKLDQKSRLEEIARLLGGDSGSLAARKHAKEMLST